MLTRAEALAVYHAMIKTGMALPDQEQIDRFVELQSSSHVVIYLLASDFYPAQFFATERDGCRWQVSVFNADTTAQETVKKTNADLMLLWQQFNN